MVRHRDDAAFAAQRAELLAQIVAALESALAAKLAQHALIDRVQNLETKIAELEAWDREAEKHQLDQIAPGVPAYTPKPDTQIVGEPKYWLCATCYHHRRKSILQLAIDGAAHREFVCPVCKVPIIVSHRLSPVRRPPRR